MLTKNVEYELRMLTKNVEYELRMLNYTGQKVE